MLSNEQKRFRKSLVKSIKIFLQKKRKSENMVAMIKESLRRYKKIYLILEIYIMKCEKVNICCKHQKVTSSYRFIQVNTKLSLLVKA